MELLESGIRVSKQEVAFWKPQARGLWRFSDQTFSRDINTDAGTSVEKIYEDAARPEF